MPVAGAAAVVEGRGGDRARTSVVAYRASGGESGRVANDATAFSHRDTIGNLLAIADWRHGDDPTEHISWLRQYWASLEPFTKGFYSNDSGVEATDATVHANYGRNYKRLVAIKNKYDPTNLFRLNANVEPSV